MRILGFLFLALWSTVALASAQGITHDAVTCMSTNEFPVVEVELPPAEFRAVRKAQVYFKASWSEQWYFVEMEPAEGSQLRATLPRPLAETNRVDYYVFALSGTFEPWQTEEYSAYVSESGCESSRGVAGAASLTLRATVANQAPIPPGFQPTGITGLVTTSGNTVAAGSAATAGGSGGVSGATIGLVAAGGGAAAAGAVVATGGDGGNDGGSSGSTSDTSPVPEADVPSTASSPSPTPTPEPTPSPTPPPTPSVPDIGGTWILNDRLTESPCQPSFVGRTSTTGMTIQQNGTALTASREGPNFTENLTGSIDTNGNLSMRGPFSDEGEPGESQWDATTTSGEEMSGRYSRFYTAHGCTIYWTFTGQKR